MTGAENGPPLREHSREPTWPNQASPGGTADARLSSSLTRDDRGR